MERIGRTEAAGGRVAIVAALVAALTLYPALVSWLALGTKSAFQFFAADTFYYLTIAKNHAPFPVFTFDGQHPTNGFHPLWQIFLRYGFQALEAISPGQETQIAFAHWTGVLCVAVAAAALAAILVRHVSSLAVALLCVVPGAVFFAIAVVHPWVGSLWSFANGLESPFSILLFALFLHLALEWRVLDDAPGPRMLLASGVLALLVLARLDDVFLVVACVVTVALHAEGHRDRAVRALQIAAVPAAATIAYMILNEHVVGAALPVSGSLKSGFELVWNLRQLVNAAFPVDRVFDDDWMIWRHLTERTVMIVGPVTISAAFLWRRARGAFAGRRNLALVLTALALYVLIKGVYNFAFVKLWHQGHWYFPISVIAANLQVALMIDEATSGRRREATSAPATPSRYRALVLTAGLALALGGVAGLLVDPGSDGASVARAKAALALQALGVVGLALCLASLPPVWRRLRAARLGAETPLAVLLVMYLANAVVASKETTGHNRGPFEFWSARDRVNAELRAIDPSMRILSFDDGVVAYALDVPVMSGFGLALDPPAANEAAAGRIVDVAWERGFAYAASLANLPPLAGRVGEDVADALVQTFWFDEAQARKWRMTLVYFDGRTGFGLMRMSPR